MILDPMNIAKWFTAVTALGTAVWGTADYLDVRPIIEKEYNVTHTNDVDRMSELEKQLAGLGDQFLLIEFQSLIEKLKQNGALTFDEQRRLCSIAKQLEYTNVPGCANGY